MLTVMCPNCRHRFPAPGCCNPGPQSTASRGGGAVIMQQTDCSRNSAFHGGGYLLVPREYRNNGAGCFINAPTIIHGPAIIQQPSNNQTTLMDKLSDRQTVFTNDDPTWNLSDGEQLTERTNRPTIFNNGGIINVDLFESSRMNDGNCRSGSMDYQINTTRALTGGTVTITTPRIQSGGCLIQSTDTDILVQAPRIEIRPKLSGGGCFVQKRLSMDDDETVEVIYRDPGRCGTILPGRLFDDTSDSDRICLVPPSGCQELPGTRRCAYSTKSTDTSSMAKHDNPNFHTVRDGPLENETERCCRHPVNRSNYLERQQQQQQQSYCDSVTGTEMQKRHSTCCCGSTTKEEDGPRRPSVTGNRPLSSGASITENTTKNIEKTPTSGDCSNGMEIRVNATVQLPPNVEHCTVNITATTGTNSETGRLGGVGSSTVGRTRNNFNGGGLIKVDANLGGLGNESVLGRREDAPTTPVSWLIPCPWQFDNYSQDKEVTRLADIKRLLHTSGWYHEGLSWQQSETLLKNASIGSWLLRDSSDSRFIFAVSVQTARGPTSVRVHYFLGKFRLDAEPRLSHNMPSFECPMKMLEHYVDYSTRIDEHRKEVWVDYSGQVYSQIYLTKPLLKEVRSLSHLARIVVNKNKLPTNHLPPLMKNYLAEYPYSL